MAKQTSNFGFTKPETNEFYDVSVQNENWNKVDEQMIPCIAKYYPVTSEKSVDTLTDPFALIAVTKDLNAELFNIVGGTFAWVWTNFYVAATANNRRMQIAMSYNTIHHKMAFRIYGANGWLEWKELTTTDMFTYGTTDLTPGTSNLETGKFYFVYE